MLFTDNWSQHTIICIRIYSLWDSITISRVVKCRFFSSLSLSARLMHSNENEKKENNNNNNNKNHKNINQYAHASTLLIESLYILTTMCVLCAQWFFHKTKIIKKFELFHRFYCDSCCVLGSYTKIEKSSRRGDQKSLVIEIENFKS